MPRIFASSRPECSVPSDNDPRVVPNPVGRRGGQGSLVDQCISPITINPADGQRTRSAFDDAPLPLTPVHDGVGQGDVVTPHIQRGIGPLLQIHPHPSAFGLGDILRISTIPGESTIVIERRLIRLTADTPTQATSPEDHLTALNVGAGCVVPSSPDTHRSISIFIKHSPDHPILVGEASGYIQVDRRRSVRYIDVMPSSHM